MAKFQKKTPAKAVEEVLQIIPTTENDSPNEAGSKTFEVSPSKEATNRHQFDDTGIQYENTGRRTRLFVVLGLLALLILTAVFAATPQGQSLILRVTNQASSSFTSTQSTISSEHSATSLSNELPTVDSRDFSESDQGQIRTELDQDLNILIEVLSSPTGFDTPDWNLELGI